MPSQGSSSALTITCVNEAFAEELAGLTGSSSGHHQYQLNSSRLNEGKVFCTVIYQHMLLG